MKRQREIDSKVNSITPGRWTAYMAAAAATSFAAGPTAEATIHYSGLINQRIAGRNEFTFPLDPAGGSFVASHINWVAGSSNFSAGGRAALYFHGAQSAAVNGATCTCSDNQEVCASNLNRRDAISVRPFAQERGILASDFYFNFWFSCGNFQNRGVGFVGFKFNNGAGDQYGWVRVRMLGGPRNYFEVVDYAYGDPGEPVSAGQTGPNTSAPVLESLGGLALGAAGLLAWRRRRQTIVH
jgi:MYXO-CTERM domain-containing protein